MPGKRRVKQASANQNVLNELSAALFAAESDRLPVTPLTDSWPGLTLEDAYRIQQLNVERRLASGDRLLGHKIGLTAAPMQEKFGVSEPDYGHLLASMWRAEDQPFHLDELIDPQVEVEPAFVLGKALMGPGLTIDDVIDATDYVCACFEVIDSRIIDWRIKLPDTVADNGSSSRFVLGRQHVDPHALALENLKTTLEIDGELVDTGNTGAILGHPALGIAWLGNKLAEFGVPLEVGHIVLPGTCIQCYRIAGHEHARGWIEGLGDVSVELTGTPATARR